MDVTTYSYTNRGSRSNNEDYCGFDVISDKGVWVLADGLGGHDCGEIASKMTTEFILKAANSVSDFSQDSLMSIMNGANRAVLEEQIKNPARKDMRTTVVAAFCQENKFNYFNVGDSRLYYFKNGCLYTQSKDHSVSQVAVSLGEISVAGIRFHDDRNKLLKVIGNQEDLNITKLDSEIIMESGDAFLLCSDGFWEYVYEIEMETDLIKSRSPKEWLEFMVKRLLLRVSNNNDNFTAVCTFVQ